MRHEVPVVIPDPFLYVERNGERHVVITPFEVERVEGQDGIQPHPYEQFGYDDLAKQGIPMEEVTLGTAVRAVKELGVAKAVVPTTFPLLLADRLRAEGIEITPDRETFVQRRRVKSQAELEGIRRAQRGAEAGMDAARELFRRTEQRDGRLIVDGEPLTCERVKNSIQRAFTDLNLLCEEFIVSHGARALPRRRRRWQARGSRPRHEGWSRAADDVSVRPTAGKRRRLTQVCSDSEPGNSKRVSTRVPRRPAVGQVRQKEA